MSHVDDGILHGYLDGELSPTEAREVDAHLAHCPDCRRRVEEERALIARAAELLALATPPDRALPPFRAGDVKPPARVWWQVRLPLAWAATVALALGIGTYLGMEVNPASRAEKALDNTAATRRPMAEPLQRELAARRASPVEKRGAVPTPPARGRADGIARPRPEPIVSADTVAPGIAERRPSPEQAAPVALRRAWSDDRNPWQKGAAISVDSARRVLGADPLVVPGAPIEALYRGRAIGYADVVIVQQALDATTMIEVISARAAPQLLDQVVVGGAPAARPEPVRAADSLAALVKRPAPLVANAAGQVRPDLFRDVRGPLSPDSLAALRRRLAPLRP
jgi:putative zinc finger protein